MSKMNEYLEFRFVKFIAGKKMYNFMKSEAVLNAN